MLELLLAGALWGLLVSSAIVVVKLVLLTYDYIKNAISRKLKDRRTKKVIQTMGDAVLKAVASDPAAVRMSATEFEKMRYEISGTHINMAFDENDKVITDLTDIYKADRVDRGVVEQFSKTILITN